MKTWVNGELLNADKMNTLEQSVPASATSSNGVVTFKNGNGTDLFSVEVGAPAPTNMITNGDFSAAGATTDGWSSIRPAYSSIAISGGKLVLTHTGQNNSLYGIQLSNLTIESGHTYYLRFKATKTMEDTDGDARILDIKFNGTAADNILCIRALTQNTIVENVCAHVAESSNTNLQITFGGNIATAASNESMLELSYIEMYDITDIVAGWTA